MSINFNRLDPLPARFIPPEAAMEISSLIASSGGVAAKKASVREMATSLATHLERTSGVDLSPLFVSTQVWPTMV